MKYIILLMLLFVGLIVQASEQLERLNKNDKSDRLNDTNGNDTITIVLNLKMIERFNNAKLDSTKTFDYITGYLNTHSFNELRELYIKKENNGIFKIQGK